MPRTFESGLHLEPEAIVSNDLQPTSRVKRMLIVGTVLLTLIAGSTSTAEAATSKEDSSVQTKRICWFSRC